MKLDTTTVLLGAVAVAAIYIATKPKELTVPASFPKNEIPSGTNTASDKWQIAFAIFNQLVASGVSIFDAVRQSKQQAGITGGYVGLHYGCSIAKVVA